MLGQTLLERVRQQQGLVEVAAKIGNSGREIHITTDDGVIETCTRSDVSISRIAEMQRYTDIEGDRVTFLFMAARL